MTKIISFINHKGGVGKTTTALNVGAALASIFNKRVLLIDLDPQANLSQSLGYQIVEGDTIYDALTTTYKLPIIHSRENLDIVCSSLDLAVAEMELVNEAGREFLLHELIEPVASEYDYILIDCQPSLGLLTLNALTASTDVVIVLQAEFLALQGMVKLIYTIDKVKNRLNKELNLLGAVLTQFEERTNLSKTVEEVVIKQFGEKVFKTRIRNNISLAEAPIHGQHIFEYKPKSNGADDYKSLAQEIENN